MSQKEEERKKWKNQRESRGRDCRRERGEDGMGEGWVAVSVEGLCGQGEYKVYLMVFAAAFGRGCFLCKETAWARRV